jgi:acetyl esterase/lipase
MVRVWCAALLGVAISQAQAQQPATVAAVDVDAFIKRDVYNDIKISPTGEFYAATVPLEDRTVLVVIRRSDKAIATKVEVGEDTIVHEFWWVNDRRVMASIAEKRGRNDTPTMTGELIAVDADGKRGKWLTSRLEYTYALMHDDLPGDDRHVLVTAISAGDNPETALEKMDVYDGSRSPVASAPVRSAVFTSDAAGAARFAHGSGNDNVGKLYYREKAGADWRLINDEAVSGIDEYAIGLSEDGTLAYLWSEHRSGTDAIQSWNPATGERRELLRDAVVDPTGVVRALDGRTPIGARYMHERIRMRYFAPDSPSAKFYRQLEKAFPGDAVAITSATRDGKLLLVQVWSDRNPGDFYIFDTVAKKAEPVLSRRIWLHPDRMSSSRSVEIVARDGLKLHGYLTLPAGREAGTPMPTILLPHGGPFGIYDSWSFDEEVQMLAQAGYAVLRVNYRGSGNYGRAFKTAGAKQWGLKMQDDLTDATRWAIAQKIADPARICIYGASYGGYAALMGAAKEPELYRCAAGYVGVYDLEKMHKDDSGSARWARNWALDWLGEREAMAAASPTRLANRIKASVFLAAGGKDRRAPVEHTEKMEKALKAAGVPVETLYYPNEGHGFYAEEHRREYYGKLLDFFSRHLGGAPAK